MAVFLGLITTMVSIFLALGVMLVLETPFHSAFALLFIPIGTYFFALISSSGYLYIKRKSNSVNTKVHIISLLFGLLAFVGIQYGEYKLTYINEDNNVNYNFVGEHVSNSYLKGDSKNKINFFEYTEMKLENRKIKIRDRIGQFYGEGFIVGKRFLTIRYIIEIIGFAVFSTSYPLFKRKK